MKKLFFISIIVSVFVVLSCAKEPDYDNETTKKENFRVLVANEGQFTYGTASISLITKDGKIINDVFRTKNKRPIGDVAQSILQIGNRLYITLNNSRKIEVIDAYTFESIETIRTLDATIPTYMAYLGGDSIAVTEKGSKGRLMIIDINHGKNRDTIRRVIEGVGGANQMLVKNNKLFISSTKGLSVFNLGNITSSSKRIIKNSKGNSIIVVGDSKIVYDKNNNIWVLTSNALYCINPNTEETIKELYFDNSVKVDMWGGRLDISPNGQTLYMSISVNDKLGIISMDINSEVAPAELSFELPDVRKLYNMSISNQETVFICDVVFGSIARGYVHEFSKTGQLIKTYQAGIFPQYLHFFNN